MFRFLSPSNLLWALVSSERKTREYRNWSLQDDPYLALQTLLASLYISPRTRKGAKTILNSGLFGPRYYLADNLDLRSHPYDPLFHFMVRGFDQGRFPNPVFDPDFYLDLHKDVADANINPLLHYIKSGGVERRRTHRLFDPGYYLDTYPEAQNSDLDPICHYLTLGAVRGFILVALDESKLDPFVVRLHQLDLNSPGSFSFDPEIYAKANSDLKSLTVTDLHDHYRNHGKFEERIASAGAFVQQICGDPRAIPLDFNSENYVAFYPDLQYFESEGRFGALQHYMRFGRFEGRIYTTDSFMPIVVSERLEKLRNRQPELAAPKEAKVCVLAHVYHADLWNELASYIGNLLDIPHHLYVNLVDSTWTEELMSEVRARFPEARIYISQNKGRDIGGFFNLLGNLEIDAYEIFCLLHTKKSPHIGELLATKWRRELLSAILGTPAIAMENILLMLNDNSVGQIGSGRWRNTEITANTRNYSKLLRMLSIGGDARECEYLSGTIMLIRGAILERLYETLKDLQFEHGDDKPVTFHRDGQYAHAVERVIGSLLRELRFEFVWR